MQNKPNFQDAQINVSIFSKMAYENKNNWTLSENKPNSNPNKPNFKRGTDALSGYLIVFTHPNLTVTREFRKEQVKARTKEKNDKTISNKP